MHASEILNIIEELVNGISWKKIKGIDTTKVGNTKVEWRSKHKTLEFYLKDRSYSVECQNESSAKALVSGYFPMLSKAETFSDLSNILDEICSGSPKTPESPTP
jgi:hypothetical protein